MNTIQVMSESLANKIAAGEVIERPASVVKELVENALDAGSNHIRVDIEEGGITKIKVTDNGEGMSRSDSKMAFQRHATSKIKSERDLFRITSLGFRGEALASISAVAKVRLRTWNGKEKSGTQLIVEQGEIKAIENAPLRRGTVVEVTDLFYNTPARYKYLKSTATELSHISHFINRLALARPDVAFQLNHHDRNLVSSPGKGDRIGVLSSIYGLQVARQMIPFQAEHIDFIIEGFLSRPEVTRANRQHLTTVINQRYVKHYGLEQAVLRAYHTLLPVHRFPIVVLRLNMDASLIDVNVHPSKLEVRLSKEKELTAWVEEALKDVLYQETLIPQPKNVSKSFNKATQQSLDLRYPLKQTGEKSRLPTKIKENDLTTAAFVPFSKERNDRLDHEKSASANTKEEQSSSHIIEELPQHRQIPLLYPLGQLHGTYILAQNEEGLYLIDQHAAQERIWYEQVLKELADPKANAVQMLAVPLVLEFTAAEALLVDQHKHFLTGMGLEIEHFGNHAYMIRSYPGWLPDGEEESTIREIIQHVIQNGSHVRWEQLRDELAKMTACQLAIKANRYLSRQEMEALLEQLRNSSNPFTCPHGRPITVLLTKYEIEKMFKRVM